MDNLQPDSYLFSVRIVSIDYYMAPPITDFDICHSSFQGGKVNEVPVIRIYGSTPAGQRTCLHVHKALPYLYVPCSELLQTSEEGDMYMRDLSSGIEKALKSKLKSSAGSKRQHVHGCSLVRAKKFYGFHSSEDLFVKIYLYYPHEVARVAALLLDGAVLDRSYQPHESHIPYLLQFLVDYNLYGMGYLHVSKVKFRFPLPDGPVRRVSRQSGETRVKLACPSAIDKADSSTHSCGGSSVWTSTTVPSGWMWLPPSVTNNLLEKDSCLIKRQSTCELEGDATADEIVNQQFKMYTSLSQTRSEVKMVQSLVPIWQEEFERTGVHEEVISFKPSKPCPENVLKTLSDGSEWRNALMDLYKEAENSSSSQVMSTQEAERFMQSIRSLADVASFCEMGEHVNPNCFNGGSFQCSDKRQRSESVSSQDLLSKRNDVLPSKSQHETQEVTASEEMTSLKKIYHSDPKGMDTEALGLLKWLASSQAEEDLNTDDELGYDLILTPLLPKTAIEQILEKANMDYECESQQECQDILDSVVDTNPSIIKEQTEHSTSDNSSTQMPSESKILKVDNLRDDLVTGCIGNLSETGLIIERVRSSRRRKQVMNRGSTKEKRKRSRLWGLLPFSSEEKVGENPASSSSNSAVISNEVKNGTPSSSSGKEDDERCEYSMFDANINDSGAKEQMELTGSSVRDLMRRKRYGRVEPSDVGACQVSKICIGKQQESSIRPRQLDFHVRDNDKEDLIPGGLSGMPLVTDEAAAVYERSSTLATRVQREHPKVHGVGFSYGKLPLTSCIDASFQGITSNNEYFVPLKRPDQIEPFGVCSRNQSITLTDGLHSETREVPEALVTIKHDIGIGSGQPDEVEKSVTFSSCLRPPDMNAQEEFDMRGNADAATKSAVPQMVNFSLQQNVQTFRSCLSPLPATTTEGMRAKYIEMSFSKKPPTLDWKNWTSHNTSFAPTVHDQTSTVNKAISEGTFGCNSGSQDFERSDDDELPPFFSDDVQDREVVHKSCRSNKLIKSSPAAALGIPTHYQNDGSPLYLLTTIYSPPSVDCVNDWLCCHRPRHAVIGTSAGSIRSKLLDKPSPHSSNGLEFSKENAFYDGKTTSDTLKLRALLTCENDMVNSHEVLGNVCHESFLECNFVPPMEPSMDKLTLKDNMDLKTENNYPELTPRLHREGTVLKGSDLTENQQDISQISGPDLRSKLTPLSQIGFRDPASVGDGQQLTLMSIEVHAESRGDLRSDPRFDAISFIAVIIQDDNDHCFEAFVILHGNKDESIQRDLDAISSCTVIVALEEKQLFYHFVKIVRSYDPDILMGWEIQGASLGFLAERAAQLGIILLNSISRTPSFETKVPAKSSETQETLGPDNILPEALITDPAVFEDSIIEDEWGRTHASGVHVGGRIVLNVWRLMRGEIKLNMYTIEAVAEEVLRRKVPLIPPKILTQWFLSGPGRARYRCIEHIMGRAKLNLEIMNQLDMINRTSELARVFGIDFFSVLSRGSQYRVESMFLRLAHTQNFLAVSPGNQQVASQPAMECLPLVMEPESSFYADPVVVLDFQSLYPSMIIAYNLCYCTCLGKVIPAKPNTLGVTSFSPDPQILKDLKTKILLTPNGVMYVPSEVRKGVLPRLLEEILSTRIMVKQAMKKLTSSEQVLYRIFNARQLALKLISNVTYGYTAAGFSGRMPCAELADSIVQCGRRTLENAISFVNSHDRWNARVVYGDTDSMFVLLKGRTMEESLNIGQEIASVITSMNPDPVTLKMEKVYHPCFLLTKKRYVGYSYENLRQCEPLFDAKGIETVRRDSCGVVAKTLEQSLRLFFECQDTCKVKMYLQRQWTKILGGRISLQDFVFAKEVRLGTYSSRSSSLPPAAIVATKAMKADPRAEPHYAERIPYVVIHGEPGARLVDMVVDPLDLLTIESPFRLNDSYYINKQIIPALQRVFGLVGADLRQWYLEMPRPVRPSAGKRFSYATNGQRMRIDSYYLSRHCFLCGELAQASTSLCEKCSKKESLVATVVSGRTSKLEKDIQHLAAICRHCGGGDWIMESGIKCVSLACTLFYERRKVQKELQAVSGVATEMGFYPRCIVEWF